MSMETERCVVCEIAKALAADTITPELALVTAVIHGEAANQLGVRGILCAPHDVMRDMIVKAVTGMDGHR